MPLPERFENVTVVCKANVYFDGKVISHTLLFADGARKTLGLIYPGEFRFDTKQPEKMEMTAGACRVKLAGENDWKSYAASDTFHIPGDSAFDIAVDNRIAQYICTFE